MNEGYRLTDFTLEELSLQVEALNLLIEYKDRLIKECLNRSDLLPLIIPTNEQREKLVEIKVRTVTAFGIVREREKLTIN